MTQTVYCPKTLMQATIDALQQAGQRRCECVVLWTGHRAGEDLRVSEVLRPPQRAKADMFVIPPDGMAVVMDHLRRTRGMIVAQVHSHPQKAFHSAADEQWAIVRHLGALSIVLPWFASRVTADSFWRDAAIFEMSLGNRWHEYDPAERMSRCRTSV
jgi:hypothetical protein